MSFLPLLIDIEDSLIYFSEFGEKPYPHLLESQGLTTISDPDNNDVRMLIQVV